MSSGQREAGFPYEILGEPANNHTDPVLHHPQPLEVTRREPTERVVGANTIAERALELAIGQATSLQELYDLINRDIYLNKTNQPLAAVTQGMGYPDPDLMELPASSIRSMLDEKYPDLASIRGVIWRFSEELEQYHHNLQEHAILVRKDQPGVEVTAAAILARNGFTSDKVPTSLYRKTEELVEKRIKAKRDQDQTTFQHSAEHYLDRGLKSPFDIERVKELKQRSLDNPWLSPSWVESQLQTMTFLIEQTIPSVERYLAAHAQEIWNTHYRNNAEFWDKSLGGRSTYGSETSGVNEAVAVKVYAEANGSIALPDETSDKVKQAAINAIFNLLIERVLTRARVIGVITNEAGHPDHIDDTPVRQRLVSNLRLRYEAHVVSDAAYGGNARDMIRLAKHDKSYAQEGASFATTSPVYRICHGDVNVLREVANICLDQDGDRLLQREIANLDLKQETNKVGETLEKLTDTAADTAARDVRSLLLGMEFGNAVSGIGVIAAWTDEWDSDRRLNYVAGYIMGAAEAQLNSDRVRGLYSESVKQRLEQFMQRRDPNATLASGEAVAEAMWKASWNSLHPTESYDDSKHNLKTLLAGHTPANA